MQRILVIDDDPSLRRFICDVLEDNGYCVEEQSDGLLGLRAYQRQPADLVLTDIVMPTKEGLEMIQELIQSFPDVKIVVMSGGLTISKFDPLPLALRFGAKRTLKKPFSPTELLDVIAQTISEK